MLKLTKELVAGYEGLEFGERNTKLTLIARHGDLSDAQELLGLYQMNPKRDELLELIRKLGNVEIGTELFCRCFDRKDALMGEFVELYHTIGYLGCQEALPRLWEKASKGDYFDCQGASLGLAHLDCTSIKDEITDEIRKIKGKSSFNKFLPLLAFKTGDDRFVEELFLWGDRDTSGISACLDCNGGLIVGVALFGENGRARFEEILWSPKWRAACSGTGSLFWTYQGLRLLKHRFADLLRQIISHTENCMDEKRTSYEVSVLLKIIDMHLSSAESVGFKFSPDPSDSWRDLRQLCDEDFDGQIANHGWGNSLSDFIAKHFGLSHELMREVYRLRDLIRIRVEQEMERNMLKTGDGVERF